MFTFMKSYYNFLLVTSGLINLILIGIDCIVYLLCPLDGIFTASVITRTYVKSIFSNDRLQSTQQFYQKTN